MPAVSRVRFPIHHRLGISALCVLLSACANKPPLPGPSPLPSLSISGTRMPAPAEEDLPAVAKPSPVPDTPALSARPLQGNPSPDSYAAREDARQLARGLSQAQGLDEAWVWEALSKARYKESASRLMMPATPGTAKNWGVYRSRFVEPIRIRAGVNFYRRHEADLKRAEAAYGVPANIIAGVLGVETIYGRQTGNYRVLDVLTTLTLDFPKGRSDRSAFFKNELGEFLKLCQEQQLEPDAVLGSYAGAIGLPQFMPSSIRRYAVDFDADGHIDLLRSPVDAIGSVAHFLAEHGWQPAWPAYFDIKPPQDEQALAKLLAPDIVPSFSVADMQGLGATLSTTGQNHPGQLALVLLQNGSDAPTLVAGTSNFYAITRYNQSSYYAMAVIQLGEVVSREAMRAN